MCQQMTYPGNVEIFKHVFRLLLCDVLAAELSRKMRYMTLVRCWANIEQLADIKGHKHKTHLTLKHSAEQAQASLAQV